MTDGAGRSAAFVAVGSNIDPQQNIIAALTALSEQTRVRATSTFYRTAPIGRPDHPMFVNGVWLIRTDLEPRAVREDLLAPIEHRLGRQRSADKFAPRTIDLDLVLYDDRVASEPDLRLPHRDIARPFVHRPILELLKNQVAEIGPGWVDRIARLLPPPATTEPPGEIMEAFTEQLRRLLPVGPS